MSPTRREGRRISDINALLFGDVHSRIPLFIGAWVALEICADLIVRRCTYLGLVQFPLSDLPTGHPLRNIGERIMQNIERSRLKG